MECYCFCGIVLCFGRFNLRKNSHNKYLPRNVTLKQLLCKRFLNKGTYLFTVNINTGRWITFRSQALFYVLFRETWFLKFLYYLEKKRVLYFTFILLRRCNFLSIFGTQLDVTDLFVTTINRLIYCSYIVNVPLCEYLIWYYWKLWIIELFLCIVINFRILYHIIITYNNIVNNYANH